MEQAENFGTLFSKNKIAFNKKFILKLLNRKLHSLFEIEIVTINNYLK